MTTMLRRVALAGFGIAACVISRADLNNFQWGPSAGDEFSIDLIISPLHSSGLGDWYASNLEVQTFGGTLIKSPLNNPRGPWLPPFPDDGSTLDTYVRSPNGPMGDAVIAGPPSYSPQSLSVAWIDIAGVPDLADFLAARVGLLVPGAESLALEPTDEPRVAQITLSTLAYPCQACTVVNTWDVYPAPEPTTLSTILLFAVCGIRRSRH